MPKSHVISFRLYEDDTYEGSALKIIADLRKEFNIRDIVTDAINARAGMTPEMFRQRGNKPSVVVMQADDVKNALSTDRSEIEALLTDFMREIKSMLRQGTFSASNSDSTSSNDDDLDETQKALISGYLARKGRR